MSDVQAEHDESCMKCGREPGEGFPIRAYDHIGQSSDGLKSLVETMETPTDEDEVVYYCDKCVDRAAEEWWNEEKQAYYFDEDGNQPGDPGYNPED